MAASENTVHYMEIVAPDPGTTARFYAKCFNWAFDAPIAELGNAYVAQLPDGSLCGIRGPLQPDETPTMRNYIRVADIERASREAEERGAVIALPPTQLGVHGRIAIYLIGGIQQGIWQLPADPA